MIEKKLIIVFICSVLISCSDAGDKDKQSKIAPSLDCEIAKFDFPARNIKQVHNDTLFILSGTRDIIFTNGDDATIFYSLDSQEIVQRIADFHVDNDTTYPFITNADGKALVDAFYIENFYLSDSYLYILAMPTLPFATIYEGQPATVKKRFSTLIKLDRENFEVVDIKSTSVSKNQIESKQTNIPSTVFAFSVRDDHHFFFRNLTFTFGKDTIPEILYGQMTDDFRINTKPYIFFDPIPTKPLTVGYGTFYGEDRKSYFNEYRHFDISGNDLVVKKNKLNVTGMQTIAESNRHAQSNILYRCLKDSATQMVTLELVQNDSTLTTTQVGKYGDEILALDFLKNETWFLIKDTTSNGFYLKRYSYAL